MSATFNAADLDKSAANGIRVALGVAGLVALLIGLAVLIWPDKTAMVLAGIIAVYAAIGGIAKVAVGIFSRQLGAWPRIGHIALGLVYLFVAIVALANLGAAAEWLAVLVGIMVGIAWIVEGIVALTMLGDSPSKTWTIIFAALSIIAGLIVVSSPLWGMSVLWWLLGISLAILGVIQIVRALRFGAK